MTVDTILDILFLPLLFLISLIIGYEDVRYGKVRNKWILLGIIWGLAVFLFAFVWYFIAFPIKGWIYTIHLSYIGKVLINAVIALVAAFLMWRFRFWAAGDAKLFVVYSLLIPLRYYEKSYFHFFPSFVLLINIFIPVFLYLLLISLVYYINARVRGSTSHTREKPSTQKKPFWERIKNKIAMLLALVGIFLILGLFNLSSLRVFIFAGLIIFSGSLSKIFKKPSAFQIIIAVLIAVLGYGFISSPAATWQILYQSIKMMAIFMVIWSLLRKLIDFYVARVGAEKMKFAVWMFIGVIITLLLKSSLLHLFL